VSAGEAPFDKINPPKHHRPSPKQDEDPEPTQLLQRLDKKEDWID
jgi:hypothetical protein